MEFLNPLGSFLSGLVSRLAVDELKAWAPTITVKFKSIAVGRLPESHRERYSEEWQSDLDAMPGDFTKVFYALDLIRAARKVAFQLRPPQPSFTFAFAKRFIDLAVATTGLLAVGPLLVAIALAIRLTSPGPILSRRMRLGKNGIPFPLYKFRTMRAGASEIFSNRLKDNPNLTSFWHMPELFTPIGRFLARNGLDELPQFYNVLTGDMSLVGPPPSPEFTNTPILVKPGMTGMFQISGNRELQQELDQKYIENQSIWLDLKILVQTLKVGIFSRLDD